RLAGSVRAFEQHGNGNAQGPGNFDQPTGADAVAADLVFLDLLKGDSEAAGELGLGQALGHAPDAHVAADGDVEGTRPFRRLFARHPRLKGKSDCELATKSRCGSPRASIKKTRALQINKQFYLRDVDIL